MKMTAFLSLFLLSLPASAGITDGLGQWKGTGATFDQTGHEGPAFTIELERSSPSAGIVDAVGKVTLADGHIIAIRQKTTVRGNGFALETNRGNGGGHCFGAGMCSTYEDAGNEHGFATTIILDGDDKLRMLTTELDHGMPVRYFRQTLTRIR